MTFLGGGFGRKAFFDYPQEAVFHFERDKRSGTGNMDTGRRYITWTFQTRYDISMCRGSK